MMKAVHDCTAFFLLSNDMLFIILKSELSELNIHILSPSSIIELRDFGLGGSYMLFSSFTSFKKQQELQVSDVFSQLKNIVTAILKREVPSNSSNSQLIFNTNLKIQQYFHAAQYHRKKIDLTTSLGVFHKEAYESTIKKYNRLKLLMDSFIILNIEEEREKINHRMRLVDDKIEKLYLELKNVKHILIPELEEKFWQAFKEDLMPILAELR